MGVEAIQIERQDKGRNGMERQPYSCNMFFN